MRLTAVRWGLLAPILLACALPVRASEPIRPTGDRAPLKLTVEGNRLSYWTVDAGAPLEIKVRGPGRVKLITRLALPENGERGYGITVHEGATRVTRSELRTVTASGVSGGGGKWGCHRDVIFTVPAGEHRYRVSVSGTDGPVAVRPRFLAPKKSRSRVSLTPATYERTIVLIRDEREITYYRVSAATPVEITVIGPTVLNVNTRLDFDRNMKGGSHSYSIEVRNSGETLARACFEIERSQVTSWRDQPDVVPGVVKALEVHIPAGAHDLEIVLTDTVACSAGVKLYIPEGDVNLAAVR